MEIFIFIFISLIFVELIYLIYYTRVVVNRKDMEATKQIMLRDHQQCLNEELHERLNDTLASEIQMNRDLNVTLRLLQLIWEARDTEAAANAVRNVANPGFSNRTDIINASFNQLKLDLGLGETEQ